MIIGRNIVLKREGNKLLLPTVERKEVEAHNLPAKSFIMCRIVSYNESSGFLTLSLDPSLVGADQYKISTDTNSEDLAPLYINKVNFISPSSFSSFSSEPSKTNSFNKSYQPSWKNEIKEIKGEKEYSQPSPPQKETSSFEIELPVKELKFSDGKVDFEYYIQRVRRKASFDVSNPFLKKEFDSIKNYFPRVLKIERFTIAIQLEFQDGKILNDLCTSTQISQIDDSILEHVEDLYIEEHIINGDRDGVLSLDDIASESSKKTGLDNLNSTEWLLNKLIVPNRTKHYYHLRYLSDKHSPNAFNLKLTGKPLSFIFLLEIPNGFCLIWETYSTQEATYVWKLVDIPMSELGSPVEELIERIKWLRCNNKMTYLRTKPENFIKIEHDYSGEDMGFKKWKYQLEKFILNNDK
jgi:hypothetical protein